MKKILLFVALCTSFISFAQNLESKIPSSAEAVISINGDRLTELVSIPEFDKYGFAKMMFKEFNRGKDSNDAYTSLHDFGFDTSSKAYYFYQRNDSVSYHNVLIKLADKNKFERLFSERDAVKIERTDRFNSMIDNDGTILWNDQLLVLTFGQKSYQYFRDNEERFKELAEIEGESNYKIQRRIVNDWTRKQAASIFNGTAGRSITSNKSYLASKDKNAAASAWVRNYGELIGGAMSSIYGMASLNSLTGTGLQSSLYGFKSIVAKVYLEEDAMRMSTEMEVSKDWQRIFKKIYKSKMNPNAFKYFDQNEVLAYMSFSMDMQAVFEEYPAMMANIYSGILPDSREEILVGSELVSMLLDEKTIGELMTGDVLFMLNDFGEQEVTYTSYEYDEDYKRKEVTKTKMDMIPDFTLMIGSEKGTFLTKAALLGVKHQLVENKSGYFKVNAPKSEIPFDLYTAVKNNMLFFTTSEDRISKIVNNRYVNNVGKHQKLIKNNISAIYVNGQQLLSKVPASELSKKEESYLKFVEQNFKDAYFKSSRMKGNKMQSEMKINTSGNQKNSLKLLFDFMEVLAK